MCSRCLQVVYVTYMRNIDRKKFKSACKFKFILGKGAGPSLICDHPPIGFARC